MTGPIMVTGASGFVGGAIVRELRRCELPVHAITYSQVRGEEDGVEWHRVNLHDRDSVRCLMQRVKPTTLIHAAWVTRHGEFWEHEQNLDWVTSTLHIARCFISCGGKRFVGVGSCAEYEWSNKELRESQAGIPNTLYGRSKLSAHLILEEFCKKRSVSYVWSRLFFLFGRSQEPSRLVPSVLDHFQRGVPFPLANPDVERDFMDVDEVGSALVMLSRSGLQGIVNIARGEGVTLKHFVEGIGRAIGVKGELIARSAAASDAPPRIVGSNRRLQSELGYKFNEDLQSRLTRVVQSYLGNELV
jgi:nucleoside-diphosphate-sugar epimerase